MTNVLSLRHRTVAPERSITSVVVYCLRKPRRRRVEASDSRSQIRGRDKSVLDDISPLPGTVGLRTVLRYAPLLEEVEYQARGRTPQLRSPSNGKLHHGRVASSVRLLEKSWRNAEADGPLSIQVLDSIGAP